MQIELYSGFKKRENSTKLPTSSDYKRTFTGFLKDPCSITNPVFTIQRFESDASPQSFTYAHIGEFSRWYFVTDWAWVRGVWECHLQIDVLGSFKTQIGNSNAYIERSASEFDGAIVDKMYPATTDFSTEMIGLTSSWTNVAPSGGCYVLGILGASNGTIGGATTFYVFTRTELNSLLSLINTDTFLSNIGFSNIESTLQQLAQQTAKTIVNPMQYVTSCMWFPVSKSSLTTSGSTADIKFGYWSLSAVFGESVTASLLTANVFTDTVSGNIPIHPQASTRGKYLNYAPYTRITMHIPPFGSFAIDTSFCEIGSYLYGTVYTDTVTGKSTLRIAVYDNPQHVGTGAIVYETSGMMGIPIQISNTTTDYVNAIEGMTSLVSSGFTKSYMGLAGSIGNTIESVMPTANSKGTNGSFLAEVVTPCMIVHHYVITDENNAEFGKPLCSTRKINTQSGYIKCLDADVDYSCYDGEKKSILKYMTDGFFWE